MPRLGWRHPSTIPTIAPVSRERYRNADTAIGGRQSLRSVRAAWDPAGRGRRWC